MMNFFTHLKCRPYTIDEEEEEEGERVCKGFLSTHYNDVSVALDCRVVKFVDIFFVLYFILN